VNKSKKGKTGEDTACKYLLKEGYSIKGRNYRKRTGEIDIIALQKDTLVFVEVKAWENVPLEEAGFSINNIKKSRIMSTAKQYIFDNEEEVSNLNIRFDFIFINALTGVIMHSKNVIMEP
jgi:putative endonuclease